jgi:hypothetical protein
MTNLRFDLEQEVRSFLQNEIDFGTRKKLEFDPETLAVVEVSDTGKCYELVDPCSIEEFLSLASRLAGGRILDLGDDLLNALSGYARNKCTNPDAFARRTIKSLKHLCLQKFLTGQPANIAPREKRLRARMHGFGYKLVKSRLRNPRTAGYGTYDIQREATGEIIIDAPFSLEGLEQWFPEDADITVGPKLTDGTP